MHPLYEHVNYDVDADQYKYHRAVTGQAQSPSMDLLRKAGGERIYPLLAIGRAAEAIIAAKNSNSYELKKVKHRSAIDIIEEETDDRQEQSNMALAALMVAQTDPRYWGVMDPEIKSYCAECKEPHPIEEFDYTENPIVCREES